jgi:hypothetical protein
MEEEVEEEDEDEGGPTQMGTEEVPSLVYGL